MTKHFSKIFGLLLVVLLAFIVVACEPKTTEPTTHTVTFVCGEDTGTVFTPASRSVVSGELTTPPTYDRPGYSASWYLCSEFVEAKCFETGTINADMNIYARWTMDIVVVQVTITFEVHGGSAVAPITINVDSVATAPADPVRAGFTFDGWFTAAEGGVEFDFAAPVTDSITLHAQWTEEVGPVAQVTLTFEVHGGSAVAPITQDSGSVIAAPADPTRLGWKFVGWFTAAEGGDEFDFALPVTASVTLHAQWTEEVVLPDYVEVTFDLQGGVFAGDVDDLVVEVEVGDFIPVLTPAPTRAGYEFVGWYTVPVTGGVRWNFLLGEVEAEMTLYARWAEPQVAAYSPIRTQQEFHDLVTGADERVTAGVVFRLMGNLDFTGFEWEQPATADERWFQGTFDGQGFTVSNITIVGTTTTRTGIFPAVGHGAVIKNLVIDNATVTYGAHAGILIGWTHQNAHVEIENIAIFDSSVRSSARGAGAIIGRVRGSSVVANTINLDTIIVAGTSVTSGGQSAGGLIGDVTNQTVNITDIIVDVDVLSTTDQAGGVIGNIRGETGGVAAPGNVRLVLTNAFVRANVRSNRNDPAQPNTIGGIIGRLGQNATGNPISTISNVVVIPVMTAMRPWRAEGGASDVHWVGRVDGAATANVANVHVVAPNFFNANELGAPTAANAIAWTAVHANSEAITATMIPGEGWTMLDGLPALTDGEVAITIDLGHRVTMIVGELTTYQYVRDGENLIPITVFGPTADEVFGHWLLAGEEFDMDTPISEPITLTPSWLDVFTVSFDTGVGGTVIPPSRVVDGRLLTLPPTPERPGFRFSHWVDFDQDTPITGDRTLVAEWIRLLTITFDANGGTPTPPAVVIDYDATVVEPEVTVLKPGHIFRYWARDGVEFDFDTQLRADTTLVAMWDVDATAQTFTIDFVCEDDSFNAFTDQVTQPALIVEPTLDPRDGYQLLGWFEFGTDNEWDFAIAPDRHLVLEARWVAVTGLEIPAPNPLSVAITTAEELFAITFNAIDPEVAVTGYFHLANDIIFPSGFNLQWQNGIFAGTLNGLGFSIIGLSTNRTNHQQGLFQRLGDGAIIENITFVNANIVSTDGNGAAVIARDADPNADVTIRNITIRNSVVTNQLRNPAGNAEGAAAGLVAYSRANITITNIIFDNVQIRNYNQRNAALIIGRAGDSGDLLSTTTIDISDIFAIDSHVHMAAAGERAGFIIGALNRPVATVENVVIIDSSVTGGTLVAGIFGRIDNNIYARGSIARNIAIIESSITATRLHADSPHPLIGISALIGTNQPMNGTGALVQNVNFVNVVRTGVNPAQAILDVDALVTLRATGFLSTAAAWSILPTITESDFWIFNSTLGLFELIRPLVPVYIPGVVRHLVTFAGEGVDIEPRDVIAGATLVLPTAPTRAGFRFGGWLLDDEPFVASMPITEAITLYADWIPTVVATFDTGDYGSDVEPMTFDQGTRIPLPLPIPTRDGHRFAGWLDGGVAFVYDIEVKANITLTASWVRVFTITFNTDGGTPVVGPSVIDENGIVVEPTVEKPGYEFRYWAHNGVEFNFDTPITADKILVAMWDEILDYEKFTIDFIGELIDEDDQVIREGFLITEPPTPIRDGFRFLGWFDGETLWTFNTPVTRDITLEGRWAVVLGPPLGDLAPESNPISTPAELFAIINILGGADNAETRNFHLTNDIDFDGFNFSMLAGDRFFSGIFDGRGYSIINMPTFANNAGLFRTLGANAIVRNVSFVNAVISSNQASGLVASMTGGNNVQIYNITVRNSSITKSGGNDNGGIIGRIAHSITIRNVYVDNMRVVATGNTRNFGIIVGGITASAGTNVNIHDIFITNSILDAGPTNTETTSRMGTIFGELSANVRLNIANVVILNQQLLHGRNYVGAIGGRANAHADTHITNVVFNGHVQIRDLAAAGDREGIGRVTSRNVTANLSNFHLVNFTHVNLTGEIHPLSTNNNVQPGAGRVTTHAALQDQAWWSSAVFASATIGVTDNRIDVVRFVDSSAWVWNPILNSYVLCRPVFEAEPNVDPVVQDVIDAIGELLPVLSVADVDGIAAIRDARAKFQDLTLDQRALVENIDLLIAAEHDLFVLELEDAIRLTSNMMMYTPAERLAIHGTHGVGANVTVVDQDLLNAFNARVAAPVHSSDFYVLIPGLFGFDGEYLEIGGESFHSSDVFRIAFGQTIVADMPIWVAQDGLVYILYIAFQSIDMDGLLVIGDLEFEIIADPQTSGITGARLGYQQGVHRLEVDAPNNQILFVRTHGNQHIHIDYGVADGAHIVRTENRHVFIDTRPGFNLATRVLYASGIMRDDRLYMNFYNTSLAPGGFFAPGTVIVSETHMTIYAMGYGIVQYTIINVELGYGTTQAEADAWTLANWRDNLQELNRVMGIRFMDIAPLEGTTFAATHGYLAGGAARRVPNQVTGDWVLINSVNTQQTTSINGSVGPTHELSTNGVTNNILPNFSDTLTHSAIMRVQATTNSSITFDTALPSAVTRIELGFQIWHNGGDRTAFGLLGFFGFEIRETSNSEWISGTNLVPLVDRGVTPTSTSPVPTGAIPDPYNIGYVDGSIYQTLVVDVLIPAGWYIRLVAVNAASGGISGSAQTRIMIPWINFYNE